MKKLLALVALGSIVLVAGCDNNNGNAGTGGITSAATLPQLMARLFDGSTDRELSQPLDINTIDIDTSSEAPTQFDSLLM